MPEGEIVYHENPPDVSRGLTLVKRRGRRWYYNQLRGSDQLSQTEAAAVLGVSRMQVNRWVREGRIPDRKVLGTSRLRVADLLKFARKNRLLPFSR